MNRTNYPTYLDSHDELDHQFSAFFKAQLPSQWPTAPARPVNVSVSRNVSTFAPGRVTLAASLACLLGLGLALSESPTFQNTSAPGNNLLNNSKADGNKFHKLMTPENQPKLP